MEGLSVFVSASIPDPDRWTGEFDPSQIRDAIVSMSREVLAAGGRIVTAAHPTVAPMLLYVAAEVVDGSPQRPPVSVYQSGLFELILPAETQRFRESGLCDFKFVEAVAGETAEPSNRSKSLRRMRREMLEETQPNAAIFVGGMEGIREEWQQVSELVPSCLRYAFGRPGGEAATLRARPASALSRQLQESDLYPYLASLVVNDIVASR